MPTKLFGADGYAANMALDHPGKPLIFTFDNMWSAGPVEDRPGWGFDWLVRQGFNVVAMMEPRTIGWYRGKGFPELCEKVNAAVAQFPVGRKLCYGSSMGGYGATAFAGLLNADAVLALSPLSSLRADIVPWESRFPFSKGPQWDGDYGDAAEGCRNVKDVVIVYDPLFHLDARHIARYRGVKYKVPGLGHALESPAQKIGLISIAFDRAISGNLRDPDPFFYARARRRRELRGYYEGMLSLESRRSTPARRFVLRYNAIIQLCGETLDEKTAQENMSWLLPFLSPGDLEKIRARKDTLQHVHPVARQALGI